MRTLKDKVQGRRQGASRRCGFTLIELLVVIAIISILAAITLPALRRARIMAREAATQSMIASLQIALSMYETDFGTFPTTAGGGYFFRQHEILSLLTGRRPADWLICPYITGISQWRGPYLEVRREDLRRIRYSPALANYRYHLVDPWGTPYVISVALDRDPDTRPPHHNVFGVDIYSLGPDGMTHGYQVYEYQYQAAFLTDDLEDGYRDDVTTGPRFDDINSWE